MKKPLTLLLFLMTIYTQAQVGIGTVNPETDLELIGTFSQNPSLSENGMTQIIFSGSWTGGSGNGDSAIIGTIGSHRTWHYDVTVIAHDVNSGVNRRSVHREFLVYRQWTNAPILLDLVTHYDYTNGVAINVSFTTNASNQLIYTLTQTSGGSTAITYRVLVRLIESN